MQCLVKLRYAVRIGPFGGDFIGKWPGSRYKFLRSDDLLPSSAWSLCGLMLYFRRHLAVPFVLATLALFSLTVGASWYVHARNLELSEAVAEDVAGVEIAQELAIGAREIRTLLNRFLLTRDPHHLDPIPAVEAQMATWLSKAEDSVHAPPGRTLVSQVRDGYRQFQREFPEACKLQGDERWQAIDRLREEVFNQVIVESSNQFLEQKQQLVRNTIRDNEEFADHLSLALLGLSVCGAGSGALVGYLISSSMRETMVQLSVPIRDAAGSLSEVIGPLPVRSANSFDEIQGNLDHLAEQVGVVVERLQQSQREALRAEQLAAVGQMAAGMAHELRNPLTSVKILIQSAIERRALGPRDLAVLEQEVTRLEQLIQSFLEFARPPRAEKVRLDLRDVVRDTVRLFRPRAERVATELAVSLPDAPVQVSGDSTQLHQLLLNLLINALDAVSRNGHIRIGLESAVDSAVPLVLLRVADDGCGMPDQLGLRIFEPFVSTKQTGIGMGLSICRRIAEDHGGKISAAAHEPRGTVVTVQLPPAETASTLAAGAPDDRRNAVAGSTEKAI